MGVQNPPFPGPFRVRFRSNGFSSNQDGEFKKKISALFDKKGKTPTLKLKTLRAIHIENYR